MFPPRYSYPPITADRTAVLRRPDPPLPEQCPGRRTPEGSTNPADPRSRPRPARRLSRLRVQRHAGTARQARRPLRQAPHPKPPSGAPAAAGHRFALSIDDAATPGGGDHAMAGSAPKDEQIRRPEQGFGEMRRRGRRRRGRSGRHRHAGGQADRQDVQARRDRQRILAAPRPRPAPLLRRRNPRARPRFDGPTPASRAAASNTATVVIGATPPPRHSRRHRRRRVSSAPLLHPGTAGVIAGGATQASTRSVIRSAHSRPPHASIVPVTSTQPPA